MSEVGFCTCGNPLPTPKPGKNGRTGKPYKYCPKCRAFSEIESHREAARRYAMRNRNGLSISKRKKRKVRAIDPLKRLGMDYVSLKLAGLIRIPKGDGKQTALENKRRKV